jgi:hypothetical protein
MMRFIRLKIMGGTHETLRLVDDTLNRGRGLEECEERGAVPAFRLGS